MLCGVFRTKERKVIAAILGLVVIIVGIIIISSVSKGGQFIEQAVMAENYLKTGSYEQAVEAYQEALSISGSDQESLSIGLADAYVGLNEYDKALEILRSCYQKTSTVKIEKKIEEVTSAKTDYEFLQSISRADVYFSNKEYDKAISDYEEAKLIKSKDMTSYQRIAQAYIAMGEYDLAREEVLEGIEITQNEELKELLSTIDKYLLKEQYDLMVAQAKEYIYQENYEDGITKYKETIILLPSEAVAYKALAQIYIDQKNYNEAVLLLSDGVELSNDSELKELLETAKKLKEAEEEKANVITELYNALKNKDLDKITAVMNITVFQEMLATDAPIYFGNAEGDSSFNDVMIIYDEEKVYYGQIGNDVKKGSGIYFMLTTNSYGQGYYYYEGEWSNDLPNGAGKTVDVSNKQNGNGEVYEDMTVAEGVYYNALEDSAMNRYFYANGVETGRIEYLAQNGVPLSMDSLNLVPSPTPATESYNISEVYQGEEKTGEKYPVEPNTIWGVKPFFK